MSADVNRRTALGLAGALTGALAGSVATGARAQTGGDPFAITRVRAHLDVLERGGDLRTGEPGERALTEYLAAQLTAAGFEAARADVAAPFFEARAAELSWPGASVRVAPQAIVRATSPDGLEAPLALWRDESDGPRVAGAIALIQLPYARHSQVVSPLIRPRIEAAVAAGARAAVLITDGPTGETIHLNAPHERALTDIPLASLGPKPGAAALAAARAGAMGRLLIDGEGGVRTGENVWGRIERGGPLLVVSTPHSGWTHALAERGPGVASFIALAHWAARALRRHSLLFTSATAHEYDNWGAHAFLDSAAAPAPARTALWVHLGAGFAARDFHEFGGYRLAPLASADPQRLLVGSAALLPALRAAYRGLAGLETPYAAARGVAGELGEIHAAGYERVFGLLGAHRFHHIDADRLDKTDPAFIRDAALATRAAIASILR